VVNQEERKQGDNYLRLYLDRQTPAILSMEYAQEVLIVPFGRITPMPNMVECVWGLFNWRSRVLWVVDLAQMLKLQPLDTTSQQYHMAIVRVGNTPLGLVVQEIKGVTQFTPERIQSPTGLVSSKLTPYLHGCIQQQQEILLVLNPEAIVHSHSFKGLSL
jgi:twitching motility protein PilI